MSKFDELKIGKKCAYAALVSPKGEVIGFNTIFKPSTKFDEKGLYNINILISKEEGEVLLDVIKEVQKAQFKNFKNKNDKLAEILALKPYSTIDDDGNEILDPSGRYILKTKAKAQIEDGVIKNRIAVFDGKLHPIKEVALGEGSIVRLKLDLSGYCVGGKVGVSIKLKAVQILKLVEYSSSNSEGFEVEEDSFEYTNSDEQVPELSDDEPDEEEEIF